MSVARTLAVALGALSSLVLAAVVIRLAPAYLDDQPIIGFLLVLGALLSLIVAFDLWSARRRPGMWSLGAAACAVIGLLYLVSAATGLPDDSDRSWWNTWVGAGLLAVSAYVVGMALWFSATAVRTRHRLPRQERVAGLRH